MSEEKTLIGKALQWIFDQFEYNWPEFVAKLFTKIPKDVLEKVIIAVKTIEAIKQWLASNKSKQVVDFIPGDWDNDLRDYLNEFLSEYDFSEVEKLFPKDSHNIATTLTSELTGISFGQSALTTEVVYQKLKANNEL